MPDATLEEVKALANKVIDEQPDFAFGHGYLWGYVNRKKTLICGIYGHANHDEIIRRVNEHPAVTNCWINLD